MHNRIHASAFETCVDWIAGDSQNFHLKAVLRTIQD